MKFLIATSMPVATSSSRCNLMSRFNAAGLSLHQGQNEFTLSPPMPSFALHTEKSTCQSSERSENEFSQNTRAPTECLNDMVDATHCNYRSVLIDMKHEAGPGDQSPVSVEAPGLFHFVADACHEACSQPASLPESDEVVGALTRCEAHMRRLERLNAMLESSSNESWSRSDNRQMLAMGLKKNKYFPAIQSLLLAVRLRNQKLTQEVPATTTSYLSDDHTPTLNTDVSEQARMCGSDIAEEVGSLLRLENQTAQTVLDILRGMSEDIPICKEEARTIVSHARAQYSPAKAALTDAVHRAATDQDAILSGQRYAPLSSTLPLAPRYPFACLSYSHTATDCPDLGAREQEAEGEPARGGRLRPRGLAAQALRTPMSDPPFPLLPRPATPPPHVHPFP